MKNCQFCKAEFEVSIDDQTFYKRIDVPEPEDCPRCRQQKRIIYRNFKTLYKRNSDKSGKPMVSMYSKKASFPVWSHKEWWADDWDATDYGRDIDFSRPFFEQFKELHDSVPRHGIMNSQSENCEYSNLTFRSKNCYLVFGCVDDEDCAFGHITWNSKQCFDTVYVYKSELCYECIDVLGSYRVHYSQESEDCSDSIGLYDCRSCTNCIGCVGLIKKNYHIFNKPVSKEEYEQFLKDNPISDPKTIEMILKKRDELRKTVPQRHFFGSHNDNVSGNHIYNAKNIQYSFDVKGGENSKYVFTGRKMQDVYDLSFSPDVELGYQVVAGSGRAIFFSHNAITSSDIYYSDNCFSCREVFGCEGLKSKEYCILNKQYSKEEYTELKAKLIEHMKSTGEWGKYLPIEMSPFAYNESIVNEYTPLTKEEAISKGFRWEDDIPRTTGQETVAYEDLEKDPEKYDLESLAKEILKCSTCTGNYRLIPQELKFYKQMKLALPQNCFNCRHQKRMDARNPRMLWPGNCVKCNQEFQTSYPPEKQKEYQIYCEDCYKAEMV